MKIRQGFVSNSSSSSFLILSKKELCSEDLMETFKVSKESPLYSFAKSMASDLLNNSDVVDIEEYVNDYRGGWEELDLDDSEMLEKAKNEGWSLYTGFIDDVDYPALCDLEIIYTDENIIIRKESGY